MVNNKKTCLILFLLIIIIVLNSCAVSNENLNVLNTCYEISEKTFHNGFQKENPDFYENDKYFVSALNSNLYDSCYTKSAFKDRGFYFSQDYKKYGDKQYQISRCKDTLIAMHLAYTLAYNSENFQKEFMTWYPEIDFYLSNRSEFIYLILEHYDCTERELNIIIDAFYNLSQKTISIVDKYKALDTVYFLVSKYNENSEKDIVFPEKIENELKVYSEYVKENPDEVAFWTGYTLG